MINKVELCGVNTSKLPLLSKKEKEELFIKIKAGDEMMSTEIQEKIRDLGQVLEYMYSIAREYHTQLQAVKAENESFKNRIISSV